VLFVVAHELGHRVENHVLKNVLVASAGLLAGFAVLALLARREGLWQWTGASGISDIRALPLLLLFALVAGIVVTPLQSGISRSFERRADEIAFDLTDDPAAPVGLFRRLAFNNLADLDPPPALVWSLFSHPPIPDRIRAALEDRGNTP
ncbi:MAG: M48 family metalloprotease, partial [Actinomycetota bacterium]